MNKSIKKLLEMLSYKRKEGSVGQQMFNYRFLQPMMGKPDSFGNYLCEVLSNGKIVPISNSISSKVAFMAHHDTVHKTDGRQKVIYDSFKKHAYVDHGECLGADCTTGVWLILEMIRNKVPGLYIVHTGEECGGIGSSALVKSKPAWLYDVEIAISFDRMDTGSIITHQMGQRTCSEAFSEDLESILNMGFNSDVGGVYTDSYEYADIVSECTNISVGYYNQHTKNEYQDVGFAEKLLDALIKADWSKLQGHRDPSVLEYEHWGVPGYSYNMAVGTQNYVKAFSSNLSNFYEEEEDDLEVLCSKYPTIGALVREFPEEVTALLSEIGYSHEELAKDILRSHSY